MGYTHVEVEADRHVPVGSLFLHLMDRDSIMPNPHRVQGARARYEKSLAGTALSLCRNETPLRRSVTPPSGRRRFPEHSKHFVFGAVESPPQSRQGCSANGGRPVDHLDSSLHITHEEPPTPRGRRHVPEPVTVSPLVLRDSRPASARARHHAMEHSHLSLSSLVPGEDLPKKREVPPPMVLKPRTTGIRMTAPPRSYSMGDRHRGIRMVRPSSHWRSVDERQRDFLEFGIDCRGTEAPLYRNQSSIGVGGGVTLKRDIDGTPRRQWRGRSNSAAPPPRSYNIITGQPC